MFVDILLESRLRVGFDLMHLDTTRTQAGRGKASTLAPINWIYSVRQLARLFWILMTRRPRIMHQPITSGISFWKEGAFMALARLFGVPIVAHLHAGAFAPFFESAHAGKRRAIVRTLEKARVMIALSDGWKRFLLETVSRQLNVVVVPNTVDPDFAQWADRRESPAAHNAMTVLYVGRLGARKGVLDALRAAPRVRERFPEIRFIFAGDAVTEADRREIDEARAASGSKGIEFPGAVSGERKRELFARADIFILPSYVENQPISVLEAMAAGLPLVVCPVGSIPEFLVDGQNALFVRPGHPEELAASLIELAARPDLRHSMGEENRAKFREEFAPETMIGHIERIYRLLLG
jgi:glycosyltransferase involved in cell wall biosynthesis